MPKASRTLIRIGRGLVAASMLLWLTSCSAVLHPLAGMGVGADSKCALRPPADLSGNFLMQQQVRLRFGETTLNFDSAVQKKNDELTILGLAPAGGSLFSLVLKGSRLTFDSRLERALPFPPCRIVEEFQRAYFPLLAGEAEDRLDGAYVGSSAGEAAVEVWHQGRLRQRKFWRRGESADAGVIVDYSGSDTASEFPRVATIRNRRFGYQITLSTTAVEQLR